MTGRLEGSTLRGASSLYSRPLRDRLAEFWPFPSCRRHEIANFQGDSGPIHWDSTVALDLQ